MPIGENNFEYKNNKKLNPSFIYYAFILRVLIGNHLNQKQCSYKLRSHIKT